jgi:hypothetical protein
MATSSPSSDFLRRNAFAVVSTVFSVALVVASYMLLRRAKGIEGVIGDRQYEGESMSRLLMSAPKLRAFHAEAKLAVDATDAALIDERNLAENLYQFYKYEEETRARLSELRQLNSAPIDDDAPYRSIPYSLQLNGTFEEVASYVRRLETGPRFLRINTFNLRRRDPASLDISLSLGIEVLGRP